jgi:hypothetical protein
LAHYTHAILFFHNTHRMIARWPAVPSPPRFGPQSTPSILWSLLGRSLGLSIVISWRALHQRFPILLRSHPFRGWPPPQPHHPSDVLVVASLSSQLVSPFPHSQVYSPLRRRRTFPCNFGCVQGLADVQLSRHDQVGSDVVAERWHFVTCGQRCFTWTTLRDELMQLLAAGRGTEDSQ